MRVDQKLEGKKAQLKYVNTVLSASDLQDWEKKEYSNLAESYAKEIESLEVAVAQLNTQYGIGGW